ncbi:glycogen-binding domain-containing protein [Aridibaculum aurantiacum]|uniref:glycogen-binding domain-containing protein n=1 Tax=Aridibaculum aurantiacum TaxID=2810307 RepID=UPI001A96E25E|nr:glycogen-binding domain-containing protein [Aridibaculum aurantiacum]
MEVTFSIQSIRAAVRLVILAAMLCIMGTSYAQEPVKIYTIRNGKMHIELSRDLPPALLDAFINKFNLHQLGLMQLIKSSRPDSLKQAGWQLQLKDGVYVLTKPFAELESFKHPSDKVNFADAANNALMFPAVSSSVRFGYNRFRNKHPFAVKDSVVTFFLKNNTRAQRVMLAGSFNNWDSQVLPMRRTDSGWIANVKLGSGKYWYKFVIDGNWQIDHDNQLRENDGLGNMNSVYFKTNTNFFTTAFPNAAKVFVAGSFNNWRQRDLPMERTASGWILPLYLADGTHTYKFVVDGKWQTDEQNPKRVPDEFGGYNSVVEKGKKHLFKLDGFTNANQVVLSGNFNGWKHHELPMKKTATGWELPYALGHGNYEYKFVVDGKWITDPANQLSVSNAEGSKNSYLTIGANYTFRLKNRKNAKAVFVAGDFNNWSSNSQQMRREGDDWVFDVFLGPGKHRYKFIVDGVWILDPGNKLWEQNEYGNGNSIIWIDPNINMPVAKQ